MPLYVALARNVPLSARTWPQGRAGLTKRRKPPRGPGTRLAAGGANVVEHHDRVLSAEEMEEFAPFGATFKTPISV